MHLLFYWKHPKNACLTQELKCLLNQPCLENFIKISTKMWRKVWTRQTGVHVFDLSADFRVFKHPKRSERVWVPDQKTFNREKVSLTHNLHINSTLHIHDMHSLFTIHSLASQFRSWMRTHGFGHLSTLLWTLSVAAHHLIVIHL